MLGCYERKRGINVTRESRERKKGLNGKELARETQKGRERESLRDARMNRNEENRIYIYIYRIK